MNVTNNYKIHLEQVMEHNGHKEVRVSVEKKRDLTGNEGASAIWQWTVDAAKVISEFSSSYDDEAALPAATPAPALPAASAEAAPPPVSSASCAPMEALPKTWPELKAMPMERQKDALHELWNLKGSVNEVAQSLGASLSSLEKLKHRLGITETSKAAYLAAKADKP